MVPSKNLQNNYLQRLRIFSYAFLIAAIFIYYQKILLNIFLKINNCLFFFLWGLNFAMLGCPLCVLPLSILVISTQSKLKEVIKIVILFQLFRFISLISVSTFLIFLSKTLQEFHLQLLSDIIVSLIVILTGLSILNTKPNLINLNIKTSSILWGIIFGITCGTRGMGFLYPFIYPQNLYHLNEIYKNILFFCLGSTLSGSIIIIGGYLGISFLKKVRIFRLFLRYFSGIFLVMWGIQFLIR